MMIRPDVHEITQLRLRNEHLEREHARLIELVRVLSNRVAELRAVTERGSDGA